MAVPKSVALDGRTLGGFAWSDESMRIPKAADLLADRLRRQIVTGRLRQGELLPPEAQLLAVFGVGRPALREALRILESESLLQVRRGSRGGAVVTLPTLSVATQAAARFLHFDGATLGDLHETQRILEPAAAARLTELGGPRIGQLRSALAEEEQLLGAGDPQPAPDASFHAAVVDLVGLKTLSVFAGVLREIAKRQAMDRLNTMSLPAREKAAQSWVKVHEELVGLAERGQAGEVYQLWQRHLAESSKALLGRTGAKQLIGLFDQASATVPGPNGNQPKMAELVADRLRREIVQGELRQGEMLPAEPQLAQRLGVGRPALREALRILETESLLTVERGSRGGARIQAPTAAGASVPVGILLQITGTTLEDVYETRSILEPAAARRLAEHGTRRAHLELRRIGEEGRELLDRPSDWIHHSVRFHSSIVELSGLKTLAFLSGVLDGIIERHWSGQTATSVVLDEFEAPASIGDRRQMRLVELIEARDGTGAEDFWRSYLSIVGERLFGRRDRSPTVLDLLT